MTRLNVFFLVLVFLTTSSITWAQTQIPRDKETIYVVVKDAKGEKVEGYLRLDPSENLTVTTKDNQERSVPVKMIESIKLEKIQGIMPGAERMGGEAYYSVRLQNSQEIFTLQKKYTFSLNTSIGLITRTFDPDLVRGVFGKDSSPATSSQSEQPSIRDKSVVFSLELKF